MPTYLYECPIHGEFEHQHSITEELQYCPLCEADSDEDHQEPQRVKRLIASGTNFILTGGGWASEGYK
jgi:predicted nucleic acid-binding Zn ribbon protein